MKKGLLFPQDCDGEQYLHCLIDAYPYDIEEARVLVLLTAQPHPSPYLLELLAYAATLSKFRLCSSEATRNPSLNTLFQNMAALKQKDNGPLHMQPFGFDAILQLCVCEVSHPYAHLPLEQIPFISQVQLHHVPLFQQPDATNISIECSSTFIYRDISMGANTFLAMSIAIADKRGIAYLSRECVQLGVCLTALYPLTALSLQQDFVLTFTLASAKNQACYYYDETSQVTIGLVSGTPRMHRIRYLKDMLQTLYNTICMEKHDLSIHVSMLQMWTGDTKKGLVFAGESRTGKGEPLDACLRVCEQKGLSAAPVYDDHGTLHYLDKEIVSTGGEVGALKNIAHSRITSIFSTFSDGLFLIQESQELHQILPLIQHANTLQLYKVTHLFYLDNVSDEYGYRRLETLDGCLDLFRKGPCRRNGQLISSYFINPLDCAQNKPVCDALLRDFFIILYLQDIPVYVLYTRRAENNTRLHEEYTASILREILGNDCENEDEPLYLQQLYVRRQCTETKEIIDVLQMKRSLIRISHEIIEYNHGVEDIVLIGIKTGGEILTGRLADIICNVEGISVPCFALDVSHWRGDREKPHPLPMESLPVKDKKAILVDGVPFKGRTVRAVMDAIMHYGRTREIQLAALVDRGHRELPICADYIEKNIPSSLREVIRVRVSEINGNDDVSISK